MAWVGKHFLSCVKNWWDISWPLRSGINSSLLKRGKYASSSAVFPFGGTRREHLDWKTKGKGLRVFINKQKERQHWSYFHTDSSLYWFITALYYPGQAAVLRSAFPCSSLGYPIEWEEWKAIIYHLWSVCLSNVQDWSTNSAPNSANTTAAYTKLRAKTPV